MKLQGVVFLAAHSSRSLAYAEEIARRGLSPERVVFYGSPERRDPALVERCESAGWEHEAIEVDEVNAPEIVDRLRELGPRVIIYSGYGGQILRAELLDCGAKFLHVHSGWLPEYRGSTTLYYSLLREGRCAASALVLDESIDTGPIVARKYYAAPGSLTEVDHGYDGSIRADLMTDALEHYAQHGELAEVDRQDPEHGCTYFVIHPVLKHLAILSLAQEKAA